MGDLQLLKQTEIASRFAEADRGQEVSVSLPVNMTTAFSGN
jgi:hypothetical protein